MNTAMLNISENKFFKKVFVFFCAFSLVSCSKPVSYELGTIYEENSLITGEILEEMNTYTILVNVLHDDEFITTAMFQGFQKGVDYLERHYENNPVVRELVSRDDFVDAYLYAVDHFDEINQTFEEGEKGAAFADNFSMFLFFSSKRCLKKFEEDGRVNVKEWYKAGGRASKNWDWIK